MSRLERAEAESRRREVAYRGSLLFCADDLVLCLFEGSSRAAVKQVSDQAGIPCERIMDSVWLEPSESVIEQGQ